MARRYLNPAKASPPVTDEKLSAARDAAATAQARLRAAEGGNPLASGWEDEYAAAAAAARAADRRLEAVEQLRAAQVERGGQRAAVVKSAAGDLKSAATGLAASRDALAAAASEHLRSLAALATAAAGHNALLAEAHAKLAELGLRTRDDWLDEGQEHAEGTIDGGGVRAGGTDWTPVPAAGLAAFACRQVFAGYGPAHPLAVVGKYSWRAYEVEHRTDGLKVPTLADAGAAVPEAPDAAPVRRALIADIMPPRETAPGGNPSGYERGPRLKMAAAR